MPPVVTPSESAVFDRVFNAFASQVWLVALLSIWGRRVARRHGTLGWQRASRAPVLALLLGVLGIGVAMALIASTFGAIANVAPSEKATQLASGITLAMYCSAPLFILSYAIYLACVIAFALGTLRRPGSGPDRSRPDRR